MSRPGKISHNTVLLAHYLSQLQIFHVKTLTSLTALVKLDMIQKEPVINHFILLSFQWNTEASYCQETFGFADTDTFDDADFSDPPPKMTCLCTQRFAVNSKVKLCLSCYLHLLAQALIWH